MSKFFDETMQGLLEAVAIDQQRISNYKERKEYIGSSDIAELTLRSEGKTQPLHFGEDGSYYAYIICGEYDIPSHYTEVARFKGKVDILDDDGFVVFYEAEEVVVYRAGEFGCIIQMKEAD